VKLLDVFALASIVVVETDPVARERIARELRELGYAVSESVEVTPVPDLQPNPYQEIISAGGVSIDTVGHRVIVDGDYVTLAPREYRLMMFLLSNQDRVRCFSRFADRRCPYTTVAQCARALRL
jgi:DNA-binding response OmpR family regulator